MSAIFDLVRLLIAAALAVIAGIAIVLLSIFFIVILVGMPIAFIAGL